VIPLLSLLRLENTPLPPSPRWYNSQLAEWKLFSALVRKSGFCKWERNVLGIITKEISKKY